MGKPINDIERTFKRESRGTREVVLSRQIEGLGNAMVRGGRVRTVVGLTVLALLALDVALHVFALVR